MYNWISSICALDAYSGAFAFSNTQSRNIAPVIWLYDESRGSNLSQLKVEIGFSIWDFILNFFH